MKSLWKTLILLLVVSGLMMACQKARPVKKIVAPDQDRVFVANVTLQPGAGSLQSILQTAGLDLAANCIEIAKLKDNSNVVELVNGPCRANQLANGVAIQQFKLVPKGAPAGILQTFTANAKTEQGEQVPTGEVTLDNTTNAYTATEVCTHEYAYDESSPRVMAGFSWYGGCTVRIEAGKYKTVDLSDIE